ncbi:DUF418 domain-containing protein [Paenibacillus sp. SYP-B3998]|uniref:DUF418 domain-containing protein n=1 Tax=Paenibacillus sp. SYP-B3998 TaxID=2678564 RepID=A0A6G4A3J8_9BACL|nr:DUF418 domain-containing protein [Paenibacillus sp. SYP-B3998]NEW08965.1 DUF418 domain-containing protein [Paenibacillus sp. SYP-B3998]
MKRIDTLDYLRGFALIGIILINITQMVDAISLREAADYDSSLDFYVNRFLDYAVFQRFYVIFSFLFGIGFYLFVSRAKARGESGNKLFIRRLLILLVFGWIHHQFQSGEALFYYAIIGFILIPFYRLKPRTNFIVAMIVLVGAFWIGYLFAILGMFLLGLCAGQLDLFRKIDAYKKQIRVVQRISLLLVPFAMYAQYIIIEKTGLLDSGMLVGGLFMSVCYVSSLTLLLEHEVMRKWLAPLKYLGRMALTNYVVQTILILSISSLFKLNNHVHVWTLMLICLGILLVQMVYSAIWLNKFNHGPMEWLWRMGTYGKLPRKYEKMDSYNQPS